METIPIFVLSSMIIMMIILALYQIVTTNKQKR